MVYCIECKSQHHKTHECEIRINKYNLLGLNSIKLKRIHMEKIQFSPITRLNTNKKCNFKKNMKQLKCVICNYDKNLVIKCKHILCKDCDESINQSSCCQLCMNEYLH